MDEISVEEDLRRLLCAGDIDEAVAVWSQWDPISPRSIGRWQGIDSSKRENSHERDLVRKILQKLPGDRGVKVAVDALLGRHMLYFDRWAWTVARYEQDLDQWRSSPYIIGVEISHGASPCSRAP